MGFCDHYKLFYIFDDIQIEFFKDLRLDTSLDQIGVIVTY